MWMTLRGRRASPFGRMIPAALALALLALLLAPGCNNSEQDGAGFWMQTPDNALAPEFTLDDLEGNQVTLSDFRGSVVLIYFWATWCPACRSGMPAIEQFYQEHKSEGVEVIGVAVYESESKAREFVQQGGYSWTFAVDGSGEVTRSYEVFVLPTSIFVDRDGLIRAMSIAPVAKSALDSKLAELNTGLPL